MAKYRKLSRTSSQRKALLRNQVTALLQHGRIITTEAKAKEVRKYDSGSVLSKLLHIPYTVVKDLAEAVETAKQVSQKGSVVLLSPAAASYGFFKNFEERGDRYQMYIKNEA